MLKLILGRALKGEFLTLIPSLIFFGLATYLSFLAVQIGENFSFAKQLTTWALILFCVGLILGACWLVYWTLYQKFTGQDNLYLLSAEE